MIMVMLLFIAGAIIIFYGLSSTKLNNSFDVSICEADAYRFRTAVESASTKKIHAASRKFIEHADVLCHDLHTCRSEYHGVRLAEMASKLACCLDEAANSVPEQILANYKRNTDRNRLLDRLNEMKFFASELLRGARNPVRYRLKDRYDEDPLADCPSQPFFIRVKIIYESGDRITKRVVDVESLIEYKGNIYIRGLCELADDERTFHGGRIIELKDMKTGEIIDQDISQWLLERAKKT